MLTVCLILAAAPSPAALPLTRATLLRDAGCWFRWEGDVTPTQGNVAAKIPSHVDVATLSVERQTDGQWRSSDFSIDPPGIPNSAATAPAGPIDANLMLRLQSPSESRPVKLRIQALSPAFKWRPIYQLELNGAESRLALRASVSAALPLDGDVAVECAAATTTPRGDGDQPWSDATIHPTTVKRLARGTSSLVVFNETVRADEFVHVELGGMAGEPGVRPTRDRAASTLRVLNKSAKAWPPGDLLVTKAGRLIARLQMPHIDAGREAELTCGPAVGVSVSREEIELERKTSAVRRETDAPDSVQTAGSVTVSNTNGHAVSVRVAKTVAGDANAASDDAKIVRTVNRLGGEQPLNEIRWNFTLGPGQSKRLTFGTSIRIQPPSEPKDNRP